MPLPLIGSLTMLTTLDGDDSNSEDCCDLKPKTILKSNSTRTKIVERTRSVASVRRLFSRIVVRSSSSLRFNVSPSIVLVITGSDYLIKLSSLGLVDDENLSSDFRYSYFYLVEESIDSIVLFIVLPYCYWLTFFFLINH